MGNTQANRVVSGGELATYSIMDISAVGGIAWSTERTSLPGYFSVVDTANYIGCTDSANINGYIKKYGNTAFKFPVGTGHDLRTLEISAPSTLTDAYATAWILGDPSLNLDPTSAFAGAHSVLSVSPPIAVVSIVGQLDWQVCDSMQLGNNTFGTGVGLTIVVSIPNMTTFSQTANLRLVGWNGNNWIDLSAVPTVNGNTENSLLSGIMIAGITAIAIGSTDLTPPLSLQLDNFQAISFKCKTELSRNTFNELNTSNFIVEQSFNSVIFYPIASIPASGSSDNSHYQITVDQPSYIMYYRLKMINNDRSFTYSPIICSRNNWTILEYMFVFPNPVSAYEKIKINFETAYRGKADYILFNIIGQKIMMKPIQVTAGRTLITLDLKGFSTATYFIIMLSENGKQIGTTQKFIIQ